MLWGVWMRVLSIVGNRPQHIKLSAIHSAMKNEHHDIIDTRQHYDYYLSDVFFEIFKLPDPTFELAVGSGTHAQQTARCMEQLESPIRAIDPDIVYVYGDTNTTLAAAIVAKKLLYPVAHIEAGCRSGEKWFVEEINRKAVDHISDVFFCPSLHCMRNLQLEGISFNAHCTGDVMVDVLNAILPNISQVKSGDYILATIHRAENTENQASLDNIVTALGECGYPVVFPIHPRTLNAIYEFDIEIPENIEVMHPADYITMMSLVKHAKQVVTDSGGLQKEAFILKVPCLTVRPATEWIETLECGWNKLVSPQHLIKYIGKNGVNRPNVVFHYYGNGNAGEKIVTATKQFLEESK
jgi:UDP-N-acetylglucosamine 2-epimerase